MKIKWKCLVGSFLGAVVGVPLVFGSLTGLCYLVGWLIFDMTDGPTNAFFGFFSIAAAVFLFSIGAALYEECSKRY